VAASSSSAALFSRSIAKRRRLFDTLALSDPAPLSAYFGEDFFIERKCFVRFSWAAIRFPTMKYYYQYCSIDSSGVRFKSESRDGLERATTLTCLK